MLAGYIIRSECCGAFFGRQPRSYHLLPGKYNTRAVDNINAGQDRLGDKSKRRVGNCEGKRTIVERRQGHWETFYVPNRANMARHCNIISVMFLRGLDYSVRFGV